MFIRLNDTVQILTGNDKGKRGKILAVDRTAGKVKVQGVNIVKKHIKPNRRNQQGGILEKEMFVDASNVALIDPQTNTPTRTGIRYEADGTKVLIAKKSGTVLRSISPPRPRYATKS